MTTELWILALSVPLLFVHIMLQAAMVTRERGLRWNAGPRDGKQPPLGRFAGRAQRALDNYKETYPAFIALALTVLVTGQTGGLAALGAILWFAARIVYLPLYLFGVPWLRTAAYGVSLLGLAFMLAALF